MGFKRYDLLNKKFNMLLVIKKLDYKAKDNSILRECVCDCGKSTILKSQVIAKGITKSCGCLKNIRTSQANRKHGMTNTKEFATWQKCIARCNNKNYQYYHRYGGRGIQCLRKTFQEFYTDMGKCPGDKYSIERIDNNGNYCKENCKWATDYEQARNRINIIIIEYNGEKKCVADWAKHFGLADSCLRYRLYKGWSIDKALNTPSRNTNNQT